MTDWAPETEAALKQWLKDHGWSHCSEGHAITKEGVSWGMRGQTEAGTEFGGVEVECPICGEDVVAVSTWFEVETQEDAVDTLKSELDG